MFRFMENPAGNSSPQNDKSTVLSLVSSVSAFEPITIRRPMKLFKGVLGLKPMVSASPDPDFLCYLLTGSSHQSVLRTITGEQYKNLENLLRGKGKSSATTIKLLESKLGIDNLPSLAHGKSDGHLFPEVLALFQLFEFIYYIFTAAIFKVPVPCAHCGNDLNDDVDHFWAHEAFSIENSEYRFVERLLTAVLGGSLLNERLKSLSKETGLGLTALDMGEPTHHPIGNWLYAVSRSYGCETLADLPIRLPVDENKPDQMFSSARIRKWASGQEILSMELAEKMIKHSPDEDTLRLLLIVARTLALAVDVVMASTKSEVSKKVAQQTVYRRLLELRTKVRLVVHTQQKKATLSVKTP